MGKADEAAEHAMAIEPVCEIGIPRTSNDVALVPVSARLPVKHRPQPLPIESGVGGRGSFAEKLPEFGIAGAGTNTGKLELEQRKVRFIEVDRVDLSRLRGEIRQRVASAGGDGDDGRSQWQSQRRQIGDRVLPDLGIDQAAKPEREKPVPDRCFSLASAVADCIRDELRVHPSPESTIRQTYRGLAAVLRQKA